MQEENIRTFIDITSIITVVSTLIGWLPPIAAIASIVWTCIQIYDWYMKKDK